MTTPTAQSARPSQPGLPSRIYIKLFVATLTVTVTVTSGLGWYIRDSYHSLKKLQAHEFRLQELTGSIRYLDEVLTMSARLAAATGDPQWEDRYRRKEPELADVIEEVKGITPDVDTTEGIGLTDAANTKLVEMEYRSFELLGQGRREEAFALLSGTEYVMQKDAYRDGMVDSLRALREEMGRNMDSQRRRTNLATTAVVVLLLLIFLSGLYALHTLRAYLKARAQAEEALQAAHSELEDRIAERTEDLTATNIRLQEEATERERAETTLRESEERYRALFEQAPDSIVQIDPHTGGFVSFNATAHESLGYTREEFQTLTLADIEVIESAQEIASHIERIVETGSDTFETKHRTKEGVVRDVLVNARMVSFHGQRLFQSIFTNITERKRVEEALQDSSKRLAALAEEQQTLLRYTSDFVYRHDTKGVFNYLSPGVEQITGRTVDEWCKHYSTYMTDNPINEEVVAKTEETLRTGKRSPPYLVEVTHKNGRRIMMEVSEQAYFDEGKVAGIIGVARDVTDRVAAEEALRASEHRLQGILDNSTAVIYAKDREGRYLLANRRFEELFHLSHQQVAGRTDYDFFSKDLADAFRRNDKRVLEQSRPVEFEETVRHDDGIHTYISLKFPLYDSADRPYAVCGISTDITERQQARQALQEAKEAAEAASKAKSTFLANVSHEVRTPIMAMLGAAELMSRGDAEASDPERLDIILRSGRYLLSLVEDLLDISRAEQGKLEIRYTVCSLLEILADVEAVVAPLHSERGIEFRVLYDTAIPGRIHTDPTRLKQAMINLVSNALKFTEGGHVFIRLRADRDAAEPKLAVSVEDTGRGIPAQDLQRIFDVFTQLDQETSAVSMGMGLGLPLAKWIAGQLGGTLDATSVEDRGSTFTLRIAIGPVDDSEWVTPEEAVASHPSVRTDRLASPLHRGSAARQRLHGRVLLAEDARDLRDLIVDVLTDTGAEVTAVSDGEEAVKAALEGTFDLILMDVWMPKMLGSDATAELRRRGCLTPIIALTAATAPGDRRRLLDGGFDDLWAKPISMDRISEGVADYLETVADGSGGQADSRTSGGASIHYAATEFARSLASRLRAIREALDASDLHRAHGLLHQLTGTAGTLGFMPVSEEAARLIRMLQEGSLAKDPELLGPLADLIERSNLPKNSE